MHTIKGEWRDYASQVNFDTALWKSYGIPKWRMLHQGVKHCHRDTHIKSPKQEEGGLQADRKDEA